MRHAAWILGYHGCDRRVGEAILAGQQEVLPSTNTHDWLGSGAYFWENSYSRAMAWANFLKDKPAISKNPVKEPFVIGAVIDPGNCLDLSEDSSLQVLKEAHASLSSIFTSSGRKLPRNEGGHAGDLDLVKRKLDCAVVNFLHRSRSQRHEASFDTVRCPFIEGGQLFEGSKFYAKTHIQWCVRNPAKYVWAYFRPKQMD
jgi:hypothetical protein